MLIVCSFSEFRGNTSNPARRIIQVQVVEFVRTGIAVEAKRRYPGRPRRHRKSTIRTVTENVTGSRNIAVTPSKRRIMFKYHLAALIGFVSIIGKNPIILVCKPSIGIIRFNTCDATKVVIKHEVNNRTLIDNIAFKKSLRDRESTKLTFHLIFSLPRTYKL